MAVDKSALVDAVSQVDGVPNKRVAAAVVTALCDYIAGQVAAGETVSLPGLGKLTSVERAGRTGRNPRTGEEVSIPARRVPVFRAGKALRDTVAGG